MGTGMRYSTGVVQVLLRTYYCSTEDGGVVYALLLIRSFRGSAAIHESFIHKNLDQSGNESAFDDCITKYKNGDDSLGKLICSSSTEAIECINTTAQGILHVWVWAYYGYGYGRMCRRRCQLFYEMCISCPDHTHTHACTHSTTVNCYT